MRIRNRIPQVLAWVVITMLCRTGMALAFQPNDAAVARPDAKVEQLLREIGDPGWRTREMATFALMNFGTEIYPNLQAHYQTSQSYEVKKRIKQITREIYIAHELGPASAFLGIQHNLSMTASADARIPTGETGLVISDVFPLTSADRAGLRPNDVWLTLNGERTSSNAFSLAQDFTEWVRRQAPGTTCEIGVFRGGRGFLLSRHSSPGFDPRGFKNLQVVVKDSEKDSRIPMGRVALEISGAEQADSRLKLEDHDLIVALDGQVFTDASNAIETFDEWKQSAVESGKQGALSGEGRALLQLLPGNKRLAAVAEVPSAQILRGGRMMNITVTLGRRPAFLRLSGEGGRVDAAAAEAADASFELWWEDQFTSRRPTTDLLENETFWRAEP